MGGYHNSLSGREHVMIDFKLLEEFSRKLAGAIPPALTDWQADSEKNARAVMESLLRKMGLVTREEFDVQAALLVRSRERLDLLEARVRELELSQDASKPR
jgi:BMFP domain-containing protein YqiC